jgi:hypothetical protein
MSIHRVDEIVFNIREKDIVLGILFCSKYSPSTKRTCKGIILLLILGPCVKFFVNWRFISISFIEMLQDTLIFYLIAIIGIICLIPLYIWFYIKPLRKTNNGILGEHKICLTEEELIESTSLNKSHVKWLGIGGVYKTKEYIFIMLAGFERVHIIPKKAFANVDDANRFYDLAVSFYENSRAVH